MTWNPKPTTDPHALVVMHYSINEVIEGPQLYGASYFDRDITCSACRKNIPSACWGHLAIEKHQWGDGTGEIRVAAYCLQCRRDH